VPDWVAGLETVDVAPLLAHLATGCGECLRDAFPAVPAPRAPRLVLPDVERAARRRAVVSGALASATLVALATSGFMHLRQSAAATRAGLTQTFARIDAVEAENRHLAAHLERADRELAAIRIAAVAPPPPARAPAAEPLPGRPPPAAEPGAPAPVVRCERDRVSVRLTRVPRVRVLEELARGTDATVHGRVADGAPVSARFDDVPLPEALRRLLGGQNFTLAYDAQNRLRTVTLLGAPQVPGRGAPPDDAAVAAAPSAPDARRVLDWRLSVPARGRLAWMLDVRSMTLGELARLSARTEDARARTEALRVVLGGLQASAELRTAVRDLLATLDDATLARTAAALGDHAPAALERAVRLLGDAELRARGAAVLAALRGAGARVAAGGASAGMD